VDGPKHLAAGQRVIAVGGGSGNALPAGTGALGLKAFLASLSILFVSTLCAFWIVRGKADFWAQGLPAAPKGMWVSSAILVLLSFASEKASRLYQRDAETYQRWFKIAFALAIGFVISQFLNWSEMIDLKLTPKTKSLYSFSFYMLTGLHAIHVVGGLIWHGLAFRKLKISPGETLRNTAVYWHFLGLCWVVLYSSLLVSMRDDVGPEQIVNACWTLTGISTVMFLLCWGNALLVILKHEGAYLATVSLIPMVAFLRAFMRADEFRLRGTLAWWTVWFGLILVGLSIGFAVKFGVEAAALRPTT
jgi:cytochrome c oxidase subunit III